MKNRAFTLIELLVVVLIIGILTAIAVPQYKKAVWKSRSRHMLVSIKALQDASQAYYLANNKYPSKFSDLDISFSGYDKACTLGFGSKTDCIANDYSELIINSVHELISAFPSGPYQMSAFLIRQAPVDYLEGATTLNQILCYHPNIGYKNMCTEFFNCNVESKDSVNEYYICNNL